MTDDTTPAHASIRDDSDTDVAETLRMLRALRSRPCTMTSEQSHADAWASGYLLALASDGLDSPPASAGEHALRGYLRGMEHLRARLR